ncbi:MAG: extracellular solute-binding protein, partial [Phycisphaerales bacterium]|nr:extracellular solute-binding protein [Phycisphaerales bacterium]
MHKRMQWSRPILIVWLFCATITSELFASHAPTPPEKHELIILRAGLLPARGDISPVAQADRQVIGLFKSRYPWIEPVSTAGLQMPGGRSTDMLPFMQIAGDIAPDLMSVNFRQSETYISMKLLYPLDQYIEAEAQVHLADSGALSTPEYRKQLATGKGWPELSKRLYDQAWDVMRRDCPYGDHCPYRDKWGQPPLARHKHVFIFPIQPLVIVMVYNRGLIAEHANEGVQQRAPRDWDELIRWAKIMTNPPHEYGMTMSFEYASWNFLSFLYSAGGEVVKQDENGIWHCVIDTPEATEAAWFFARLRLEKIVRNGRTYRGVMVAADNIDPNVRYAYVFNYIDSQFFSQATDLSTTGIGPVPAGPSGLQHSEFNARMVGIFAGLRDQPERRDAAWAYTMFYDGPEARKLRMEKMVDSGLGRFVRPEILREFNTDGRYNDIIRQIPKELDETYRIAMTGGIPEPYGKNCQYVYYELQKPLGEILNNPDVIAAVDSGDAQAGKAIISQILKRSARAIDQKLLGLLPPPVERRRQVISWVVIALVAAIFALVFRWVFRTFRPPEGLEAGAWQFGKYRYAYMLMLPAVLTIGMWMYWPLVKGTVIAFQDYSVLGESQWVGSAHFAT